MRRRQTVIRDPLVLSLSLDYVSVAHVEGDMSLITDDVSGLHGIITHFLTDAPHGITVAGA